MDPFIADFGLDARFDVIPYDEILVPDAALPEGTVIFSDVDRLSKRERHAAIALADRLLLAGRRVLNHPANVLGRVELLRRLKLSGINPFSLYRLVELANVRSLRYPVFVRTDSEHSGSLSPLIGRRSGSSIGFCAKTSGAGASPICSWSSTRTLRIRRRASSESIRT